MVWSSLSCLWSIDYPLYKVELRTAIKAAPVAVLSFARAVGNGKESTQIELWTNHEAYEHKVYTLPKHLDEKVALLHLDRLGAKLTKLTAEQADYIDVPVDGPFKADQYRY